MSKDINGVSALSSFVESTTELLISSWAIMLLIGALADTYGISTFSYFEALGSLYLLKCLTSSLMSSVYTLLKVKIMTELK